MTDDPIRAVNGGCIAYQTLKAWKYRLTQDHIEDIEILPPDNVNIRAKDGTLIASLSITGRLFIARDYCYDGASGPTIDTPDTMRPSLLHDVMYQYMRLGILPQDPFKEQADRLLQRRLIEDGKKLAAKETSWLKRKWIESTIELRAGAWYQAVHRFAGDACKPGPDPITVEIIAP